MAKNFNSKSQNRTNTLASGHITLTKSEQIYKGEKRLQMSGKIQTTNGTIIYCNIPVDSNGRLLSYKGKGDNSDKTYARMYCTEIEGKNRNSSF